MRQLKITKSITNRESASLDKYLQEIGREELVSPEEEVELAQRIRKGDQVALEKLTRANLRFVVSVAKLIITLTRKVPTDNIKPKSDDDLIGGIGTIVLMLLYMAMFQPVGFVLSSAVYLVSLRKQRVFGRGSMGVPEAAEE